ncbi:T9SS type A sorting domain-containing protein [Brumimicrobium aurantiacum]|uniref:T9SS C-terminal target domain-containing protein n=1 Tax=Brumimicrobium aurantiacum TaxID=1737063 RepID=A0A3E1F162_9FLAO|nr:T9SS type A sorting domain-containing protein [Brumimicrobium aurantiacum]RFC55548.1 T9SS C-terminal target domain-containing protein [Brumimicrobium aurantiacum]
MQSLLLLLLLAVTSVFYAQNGPAGVGNNSTNRFWQDATRINQNNNTLISSWNNNGGNSLNPSQSNSSYRPKLLTNNINSIYSSVSFDGTNDRLRIENTSDINSGSNIQRTFFIVFTTESNVSTRQIVYEEGGTIRGFNFYLLNEKLYCGAWNRNNDGVGAPWNFKSVNTPVLPNTTYVLSFIYKGNNSITGNIECYLNGDLFGTITGVGRIYNHNRGLMGCKEQDTHYENGTSSGTGHYFKGSISEFIHYNYPVNSAQRIIVNNYLAAKYNLTLAANDLFTQDIPSNGNYDHEVAGIGRISSSDLHNDAKGSGIVRVLNPTGLGNNEFLIWGHNNGEQQAINLTDVPSGVKARFDRVWRVSERNSTNTNSVNVGNIDMRWDLNGLGSITASDLRLLIDKNNNGNFIDDTPISGAVHLGGGIYEFTNIPGGLAGIQNEKRFTLGTINKDQTPLPIELVYFTAILNEKKTVNLEWQTASERNNDFFTVEKSIHGSYWDSITTVDGAGSSSCVRNYSTTDFNPHMGISYYRLKQTDFNGEFEYSSIRSVNLKLSDEEELKVYPNPTQEMITVNGSAEELSFIKLINVQGKDVGKTLNFEKTDESILFIDLSSLSNGVYFLKTRTKVSRIVKN